MQRLLDEGQGVGPGAYDVQGKRRVKGFASVRSARTDPVSGRKDGMCGPGSYQPNYSYVHDKTQASTINRSDIKQKPFRTAVDKRFRRKNKGSIRADWDEDSDEEYSVKSDDDHIGPGLYNTERQTSSFVDYMSNKEKTSPK